MCFLPYFLESLKAPILPERSRIRLNHIPNIQIQRLKWISHNIRSNELFALYKCIPPPLPASWSHLKEQIYQWNIFIWRFVFLTLICCWGFFYLLIFVCYLEVFLRIFLFHDFCLLPWYVFEDASWPVANLEQRSQLSGTDLYVSTWGKTSDELQSQQGRLLYKRTSCVVQKFWLAKLCFSYSVLKMRRVTERMVQ